jgi:hypothetical protein
MPNCVVGAASRQEVRDMEPLKGYDAAYALRGWRDAGKPAAPEEITAHDPEALRAKVDAFMAEGRHAYVELAAWNFELNDWVRVEAFDAG